VGVFAGILFLGEQPGTREWLALLLVLLALFTVLWQPAARAPAGAAPLAPDD
jgi:drug/metabolite transporter (DMT)-like permease